MAPHSPMMVLRRKKFPLCVVAHTSFRSVRVIHRQRQREAHAEKHTKDRGQSAVARGPVAAGTGGTSDCRGDDETVVLVARTSGLAAKLRRVLSRSGLVLTALA